MSDGIPQEAQGATHPGSGAPGERRMRPDRRQRIWWSLLYGSFRPRRRGQARRTVDERYPALDWYGAHLWAVSIGILTLCVADALLTVRLMSGGAIEANPLMAAVVGRDVTVFAALKTAVTGLCVMLLVFLARYRFMRLVRVEVILYCVLGAYALLICHEIGMLRQLVDGRLL